jgi:hypothetical protein
VAVADDVAVRVAVAVGVAVRVAATVGLVVAVGVAVGDGANPIPLSFTFCGLWAAASANSSSPRLNLPLLGGAKITETWQLPPGEIVLVHPLVSSMKPVPVTLTVGAARSALPLLVRVTIFGMLVDPAGHLPKLIFLADNPTFRMFLVDKGMDCAIAKPLSAYEQAHIVTTLIARRITVVLAVLHFVPSSPRRWLPVSVSRGCRWRIKSQLLH